MEMLFVLQNPYSISCTSSTFEDDSMKPVDSTMLQVSGLTLGAKVHRIENVILIARGVGIYRVNLTKIACKYHLSSS